MPSSVSSSTSGGSWSMVNKLEEELFKESNGVWVGWLAKLETATGQPRKRIAFAAAAILGSYLVIGFAAELVCNGIGMLYPAYASMKAIKSKQKGDDTQWLIYWTVFAVFTIVDFFSDAIMSWFPLYWLAKVGFLFWLWCPLTMGANIVYQKWLLPFMDKYGHIFEAWEAKVKGS